MTYRLLDTEARRATGTTASYAGVFGSGALFGRWRRLVGPVALDLGLRWDLQHYQAADRLAGTAARGRTHQLISPKLGARYLMSGALALAGSVARGFRGAPGVISDPAREPERVWAKELGSEWVGALAQVQLALFRLDCRGRAGPGPDYPGHYRGRPKRSARR